MTLFRRLVDRFRPWRLTHDRPAAVCATCGKQYRSGSYPVSHGLCPAHQRDYERQVDAALERVA